MLFTVCCYWMQLSRLCVTMAARSQCHTASSNKPLLQYCHKQNWYLLSPWVLDIRKMIFRQVHLFWKITISLLRSHITVNFPVFPTHNYSSVAFYKIWPKMVRVHFYNPRTQYGAQSIRQWWKMKLAKKSKQFPQRKQLGEIITLEKKTHLIKTVIMQAVRVNGHAKSEDDCNDRHYDLITLNIKCSRKCAIPLLLSFSWRCPASATMPTYNNAV